MIALGAFLLFGLAIGAVALTMTVINLRVYRAGPTPRPRPAGDPALICVCIPARNEEANIDECVRSLLASEGVHFEVLVYDDQSTDRTPEIVASLCREDARVVRVVTRPLPPEWNGKQHACFRMAEAARQREASWMLFTDADVRFEPAALARALTHAEAGGLGLLSTFPRQITGSWAERAVVPMIFFILFSYLPMPRMRRTLSPAASAGCGQFLFARTDAYFACGGHEGFRDSMHDGIMLPRAVRRAGFRTDLFDGTSLCRVRMYRGLGQTWRGFAKNAFEGLGSVPLLVFITIAHLSGHVLPWVYLAGAGLGLWGWALLGPAVVCILMALAQRVLLARAFGHGAASVALHPLGVLMMTLIQWHSLILAKTGRRTWRGRTHGQPAAL